MPTDMSVPTSTDRAVLRLFCLVEESQYLAQRVNEAKKSLMASGDLAKTAKEIEEVEQAIARSESMLSSASVQKEVEVEVQDQSGSVEKK
jgi:hypothetical protein